MNSKQGRSAILKSDYNQTQKTRNGYYLKQKSIGNCENKFRDYSKNTYQGVYHVTYVKMAILNIPMSEKQKRIANFR